jgi:hypothetical protein
MADFGIPNIDPELAEPLGQIIVRWSSTEYLISMLLGTLVFADLAGIQVVTTNIARSERNEFVHGHWDTTNCEPRTALVHTINLDRNEVIRERLVTKCD